MALIGKKTDDTLYFPTGLYTDVTKIHHFVRGASSVESVFSRPLTSLISQETQCGWDFHFISQKNGINPCQTSEEYPLLNIADRSMSSPIDHCFDAISTHGPYPRSLDNSIQLSPQELCIAQYILATIATRITACLSLVSTVAEMSHCGVAVSQHSDRAGDTSSDSNSTRNSDDTSPSRQKSTRSASSSNPPTRSRRSLATSGGYGSGGDDEDDEHRRRLQRPSSHADDVIEIDTTTDPSEEDDDDDDDENDDNDETELDDTRHLADDDISEVDFDDSEVSSNLDGKAVNSMTDNEDDPTLSTLPISDLQSTSSQSEGKLKLSFTRTTNRQSSTTELQPPGNTSNSSADTGAQPPLIFYALAAREKHYFSEQAQKRYDPRSSHRDASRKCVSCRSNTTATFCGKCRDRSFRNNNYICNMCLHIPVEYTIAYHPSLPEHAPEAPVLSTHDILQKDQQMIGNTSTTASTAIATTRSTSTLDQHQQVPSSGARAPLFCCLCKVGQYISLGLQSAFSWDYDSEVQCYRYPSFHPFYGAVVGCIPEDYLMPLVDFTTKELSTDPKYSLEQRYLNEPVSETNVHPSKQGPTEPITRRSNRLDSRKSLARTPRSSTAADPTAPAEISQLGVKESQAIRHSLVQPTEYEVIHEVERKPRRPKKQSRKRPAPSSSTSQTEVNSALPEMDPSKMTKQASDGGSYSVPNTSTLALLTPGVVQRPSTNRDDSSGRYTRDKRQKLSTIPPSNSSSVVQLQNKYESYGRSPKDALELFETQFFVKEHIKRQMEDQYQTLRASRQPHPSKQPPRTFPPVLTCRPASRIVQNSNHGVMRQVSVPKATAPSHITSMAVRSHVNQHNARYASIAEPTHRKSKDKTGTFLEGVAAPLLEFNFPQLETLPLPDPKIIISAAAHSQGTSMPSTGQGPTTTTTNSSEDEDPVVLLQSFSRLIQQRVLLANDVKSNYQWHIKNQEQQKHQRSQYDILQQANSLLNTRLQQVISKLIVNSGYDYKTLTTLATELAATPNLTKTTLAAQYPSGIDGNQTNTSLQTPSGQQVTMDESHGMSDDHESKPEIIKESPGTSANGIPLLDQIDTKPDTSDSKQTTEDNQHQHQHQHHDEDLEPRTKDQDLDTSSSIAPSVIPLFPNTSSDDKSQLHHQQHLQQGLSASTNPSSLSYCEPGSVLAHLMARTTAIGSHNAAHNDGFHDKLSQADRENANDDITLRLSNLISIANHINQVMSYIHRFDHEYNVAYLNNTEKSPDELYQTTQHIMQKQSTAKLLLCDLQKQLLDLMLQTQNSLNRHTKIHHEILQLHTILNNQFNEVNQRQTILQKRQRQHTALLFAQEVATNLALDHINNNAANTNNDHHMNHMNGGSGENPHHLSGLESSQNGHSPTDRIPPKEMYREHYRNFFIQFLATHQVDITSLSPEAVLSCQEQFEKRHGKELMDFYEICQTTDLTYEDWEKLKAKIMRYHTQLASQQSSTDDVTTATAAASTTVDTKTSTTAESLSDSLEIKSADEPASETTSTVELIPLEPTHSQDGNKNDTSSTMDDSDPIKQDTSEQ